MVHAERSLINLFSFDFITGMSVGIEFFVGEDLQDGDSFAMTIDLLIIRVTYVRSKNL